MDTPPPKRIKISTIQNEELREFIKSEYRMQHAQGVDYTEAYDLAFNELIKQSSKYISECKTDIINELMMNYSQQEARKLCKSISKFYCTQFYDILVEKTDELIESCDERFEVGEGDILEEDLVQMRENFKNFDELEKNKFRNRVEVMKSEIFEQILKI